MTIERETAADRIARILAEILWIEAQGGAPLDEAAARFGITEQQLAADLELASMIGGERADYADMPVEMYYEHGRAIVHLYGFDRPLRLTPGEGLALVAAGAAVASTEAHPEGPLHRALTKVAAVLGIEVGEQIEVDLGVGDPEVFATIRSATDQHRAVRLTHLAVSSDQRSERVVEPWQLFRDEGRWYLSAWCRLAKGPRTFRVDRIVEASLTDEPIEAPDPLPAPAALSRPADAPRVTLDLDPAARWVVENHPAEAVEARPDGGVRATLVVVSEAWLARLLLRLGSQARIVELDPALGPEDPGRSAARRILARYGATEGEG